MEGTSAVCQDTESRFTNWWWIGSWKESRDERQISIENIPRFLSWTTEQAGVLMWERVQRTDVRVTPSLRYQRITKKSLVIYCKQTFSQIERWSLDYC